jgi:hypothetical protein
MPATDALWGGQLKAVAFDPVVHRLALQIEVIDRGLRPAYDLECSGVMELRFTNAIPEPWSYAEVTEVHTSQTAAGKCMVEVVLWSEDCVLVCTCDSVRVAERS